MIRKFLNKREIINRRCDIHRGRIAYWLTLPNLEGGSTFYDIIGSNHGTLTNSPTWEKTTRPGGYGNINFTQSPYINVSSSNINNLSLFTISVWIFPRSAGDTNFGRIFDKLVTNGGWSLLFNGTGSELRFQRNSPGTLQVDTTGGSINLNSWNHIILTWDGGLTSANVKVYINGVSRTLSQVGAGSGVASSDSGQSLAIGNRTTGSRAFDGYMDDISIWNRVLSDSEAFFLYEDSRRGYPRTLRTSKVFLSKKLTLGTAKTTSCSIAGFGILNCNGKLISKSSILINGICTTNNIIRRLRQTTTSITGICNTISRGNRRAISSSSITGKATVNSVGKTLLFSVSSIIGNAISIFIATKNSSTIFVVKTHRMTQYLMGAFRKVLYYYKYTDDN